MMKVYNFTLLLIDVKEDLTFEEIAAALYENGCDDGTYSVSNGLHSVEFHREAECFDDAVENASIDIAMADICEDVIIYFIF
jgi:hypothetical protein